MYRNIGEKVIKLSKKIEGVLYARFSPRRNEEECESIEVQFQHIMRYCQNNQIEILDKYDDRAFSGDDEDRPGLWQAIGALKKNSLLLVYKLDRIARSVYLSHIIEKAVADKGARIVSISGEGTWIDSPQDTLTRQILQALAEYEKKVIAARTRIAMQFHQRNGRRMSSKPPFGTMIDPADASRLIPNPDEEKIIEMVVKLKEKEGLSLREIAKRLTELDCKPRLKTTMFNNRPVNVRSKWNPALIANILKRAQAT